MEFIMKKTSEKRRINLTAVLFLLIVILVSGCGGGGGGGSNFVSNYADTWDGDWTITDSIQEGTITLIIANNGAISGSIKNTALGYEFTSTITGTSDNTNFSFYYKDGSATGTVKGTFSLDSNGHLIGNFQNSIGNNNYTGTFDLQKSGYKVSGKVYSGDGIYTLSSLTINFSNEYTSVVSDSWGQWEKDYLRGSVTVTPYRYGCTFKEASYTFSSAASNVNFYLESYQNDFSVSDGRWFADDTGDNIDNNGYCSYTDGEFEIGVNKVTALENCYCGVPYISLINTLEIKAYTYTATDSYNYGFTIHRDNSVNVYTFLINPVTQTYGIFYYNYTGTSGWFTIKDWTTDSQINSSGSNILKLSQNGTQIDFYVNGYLLYSYTLGSLTGTNAMAYNIIVRNRSTTQSNLAIRFDDFKMTNSTP
jgi:hypothetical protein